jgi:hypothetical protein
MKHNLLRSRFLWAIQGTPRRAPHSPIAGIFTRRTIKWQIKILAKVASRADKTVKVANTKVARAVSKAADSRSPASSSSSRNLDAKVASKVAVKADSRVSASPSPFL